MKKIVFITLILLSTGCFEESGHLTKKCIKTDIANELSNITIYTFSFKNDVIDKLVVNYDYNSSDKSTISSIKLSNETQNKYFKDLKYNVIYDEENHYQIEYDLDINSNDEIKNKFVIREKRSELVEALELEGFDCE